MAGLLVKLIRYDSIYLRTNGVWADIGAPGPVVADAWASQGAVGIAPDGTIFMIYNNGGASPGGWLWEWAGGTSWTELTSGPGRQALARGAEFFPTSADDIWFVGDNTGGIHAVHWTRSGGFSGETLPGYSPGSGNSVGSCIKLPNGDVLLSFRAQVGGGKCVVWRRPVDYNGTTIDWVLELNAGVGSGGAGEAIFSPDGINVWVSSDNDRLYHSTDSGLNWAGPISNTGFIGHVTAITGDAADNVYFFYSDGTIFRYNGSTYDVVTALAGSQSSAAYLDGKPITDVTANAHVVFELNGSWVANGPGVPVQNDFGSFVSMAAVQSDSIAPGVIPIDPVDGATGVAKDASASFKIIDIGSTVLLVTILVYVRGVLIFNGLTGAFAAGWKQSTFAANSENGYTFVLRPDRLFWWRSLETTTVRVIGDDSSANHADTSYSFTGSIKPFRHSIYPMIVGSVRKGDES